MITRAENLFTWLVAAAYVGALAMSAHVLGVLGIARNDDWSFVENAFRFQETGIFAVGGWVQMNLIGQLVLAAPIITAFGQSIAALQILGIVFTGVAVAATYLLARSFLPRRLALTIGATTALSPVLLVISASFMTDAFALAGQLSALVLATYAMTKSGPTRSWMWWAAIAIGLWAFSVREFSAIALAAIAMFALVTSAIKQWQRILSVVVMVGGTTLIVVWRSMQVTETQSTVTLDLDRFDYLAALPVTLGILALPAMVWIRPVLVVRKFTPVMWTVFLLVLVTIVGMLSSTRTFVAGNYFQQVPPYSSVIPGSPEAVFPTWLWICVLIVGAVGVVIGLSVLIGLARSLAWPTLGRLRSWSENPGLFMAAAFSGGSAVVLSVLPFIAGVPVYDRYLLGLIAVAPGPLLWWANRQGAIRSNATLPVASAAFLAFVGVVAFVAAGRLDSARWAMAEEIGDSEAVSDGNIDAGFDWFRFHTEGIPRPDSWPPRYTWWSLDDARAVCVTITYEQPPPAGIAAFPDASSPTLLERTVSLPFSSQVLVAKPGPDSCP